MTADLAGFFLLAFILLLGLLAYGRRNHDVHHQ